MNKEIQISQKVSIEHLRRMLSKDMSKKRFYEDSTKSQEENIELIIERAKNVSQDLDAFLNDVISNIKNKYLRSYLIRYLISVKFNVDSFYISQSRSYIKDVLDGCVLIQCNPSGSTMLLTLNGEVKYEENQYYFQGNSQFIRAQKFAKNKLSQQQQLELRRYPKHIQNKLLYRMENGVGLFSLNGAEIIPCCFEQIGFWNHPATQNLAKIWHNNIGYLLYPISDLSAIHDKDILIEDYGYSEWVIQDYDGALYRLSLSDCYLYDWSLIEPDFCVSFKDVDMITDYAYSRPEIYNLSEYKYRERMESYTDEEIIKLLTETANEVTNLIGELHIIPKDKL